MSIDIKNLVPTSFEPYLTDEEREYLEAVFRRFNGYPNMIELWELMDEQWVEHGCDPLNLDERVSRFYDHPVWLLNGLFIEQDELSLAHRGTFVDWIAELNPERVADIGGGTGCLARMIGQRLPNAQIEVIEPHPKACAVAACSGFSNVSFQRELEGSFDLLIATDVFEHVDDPIKLVADTAKNLAQDGTYLMANCFLPEILCHLPQHFHLNAAWDPVMRTLGFVPGVRVGYGRCYRLANKPFNLAAAYDLSARAEKICRQTDYLPGFLKRVRRRVLQVVL